MRSTENVTVQKRKWRWMVHGRSVWEMGHGRMQERNASSYLHGMDQFLGMSQHGRIHSCLSAQPTQSLNSISIANGDDHWPDVGGTWTRRIHSGSGDRQGPLMNSPGIHGGGNCILEQCYRSLRSPNQAHEKVSYARIHDQDELTDPWNEREPQCRCSEGQYRCPRPPALVREILVSTGFQ